MRGGTIRRTSIFDPLGQAMGGFMALTSQPIGQPLGTASSVVDRYTVVKKPDAVAGEMYLPGATIKFSKTPTPIGEVPTPGQHTDEVLGRLLGYDRATLDSLRQARTIA